MTSSQTVGERLRSRRQQLGLRQADLAGDRVTTGYVSLIESGKRLPTAEVLEHLAERLDSTVTYLRDGVEPEAALRTQLDLDYAELALRNGDPAAAKTVYARLVADPSLPPNRCWDARWGLARATESLGDLDAAIDGYEELVGEAAEDPFSRPWLTVATAVCRCSLEAGDVARATELAERTLAAAAHHGLAVGDAHAELLSTLVLCYYRRNDLVHASRLARDLIDITEASGSRRARGAAYWNAAGVAEARGNLSAAVALAERAVALYAEDDDERSLARVSVAAAWFLMRATPPQPEKSRVLLRRALATLGETGSAVDLAYAHTEMSRAELLLGDAEAALTWARRAVELLGDVPRIESVTAQLGVAAALYGAGRVADARQQLGRAEETLRTLAPSRASAMGWRRVGDLYRDLGDEHAALMALDMALAASGLPARPTSPRMQSRAQPASAAGREGG